MHFFTESETRFSVNPNLYSAIEYALRDRELCKEMPKTVIYCHNGTCDLNISAELLIVQFCENICILLQLLIGSTLRSNKASLKCLSGQKYIRAYIHLSTKKFL